MTWSAKPNHFKRLGIIMMMRFYSMLGIWTATAVTAVWFNKNAAPKCGVDSHMGVFPIRLLFTGL